MINWQFHFVPLPRPNPHLLREDGGVRTNFVQTLPLLGYALLAIATALLCLIVSPVLAKSPATDFTASYLSSSSINLQDLVQQGKVLYESG